jgi:hypothetical protein
VQKPGPSCLDPVTRRLAFCRRNSWSGALFWDYKDVITAAFNDRRSPGSRSGLKFPIAGSDQHQVSTSSGWATENPGGLGGIDERVNPGKFLTLLNVRLDFLEWGGERKMPAVTDRPSGRRSAGLSRSPEQQ